MGADNIALLENTPIQAESLLHSLEQITGGIGLHRNSDETKYMCFHREGAISTLKLVDKFTYLGSSISSIESDIKMCLAKALTAIHKLSIIWKSDLSDKKPQDFV